MPRNFRKTYYKCLGVPVLLSAEVEASFAALLGQDTPSPALTINLTQLVRLTLEFGLPSTYRRQVWWVLSGIVPLVRDTDADSWEYARKEKSVIYYDVAQAAESCLPDLPSHLSASRPVLRVLRFYVDQIRPHLSTSFAADRTLASSDQGFDWVLRDEWVAESVANAVAQVMDDPSDQFWTLLAFLDLLDRGFLALQPPVELQDLRDVAPGALEFVVCRILAATVVI